MKSEMGAYSIPVFDSNFQIASLVPVTSKIIAADKKIVSLAAKWRNQHRESFTTWISATSESTENWIRDQIINREDRILFLIHKDGAYVGHIGLTNFDFEAKTCEIDNVLRGRSDLLRGGMTLALKALLGWCFDELKLSSVFLKVFADNHKAVALYHRCGFKLVQKVPLRRVENKDRVDWIEVTDEQAKAEKFLAYMSVAQTKEYLGREKNE